MARTVQEPYGADVPLRPGQTRSSLLGTQPLPGPLWTQWPAVATMSGAYIQPEHHFRVCPPVVRVIQTVALAGKVVVGSIRTRSSGGKTPLTPISPGVTPEPVAAGRAAPGNAPPGNAAPL